MEEQENSTSVNDEAEIPEPPVQEKILTVPLRISLLMLGVSIYLKISHYPGASAVGILAFSGLILLYPIRFWYKQAKGTLDYIKLSLVLSWALNGIFALLHWPRIIFGLVALLSFCAWITMEIVAFLKPDKTTGESSFKSQGYSVIIGIAVGLVLVGALFKIQHYPGANMLLLLGLGLAGVWILKDLISNR